MVSSFASLLCYQSESKFILLGYNSFSPNSIVNMPLDLALKFNQPLKNYEI